ncbi:hypothetical protein A3Q56_01768 [Intoshia linei]|uniref:Uncharacterized protein n=1 Tax=Intoshia linei TaxID=1819745 RepID=A0A177B853_9BILA|nr:hypothetical protein A3Q56_01768 [Intoshia linei]
MSNLNIISSEIDEYTTSMCSVRDSINEFEKHEIIKQNLFKSNELMKHIFTAHKIHRSAQLKKILKTCNDYIKDRQCLSYQEISNNVENIAKEFTDCVSAFVLKPSMGIEKMTKNIKVSKDKSKKSEKYKSKESSISNETYNEKPKIDLIELDDEESKEILNIQKSVSIDNEVATNIYNEFIKMDKYLTKLKTIIFYRHNIEQYYVSGLSALDVVEENFSEFTLGC